MSEVVAVERYQEFPLPNGAGHIHIRIVCKQLQIKNHLTM